MVLDFCLLEDLISHFQFQYLWLVLSYFLFLSSSVLDSTFTRICPFFLGWTFYWHIVSCSSLMILCISFGISCNYSFFISNFIDLSSLLFFFFFLLSLAKRLSILFIFSKNQLLVSLIFAVVCLYFIYSWSGLYNFFPSTNLGFYLFFLF